MTPAAKPTAPDAAPDMGRDMTTPTVSGVRWATGVAVVVKAQSFLAQIALGWLLTPEAFGQFVRVLSMFSLLGSGRDAAVSRLLIQRGKEHARLAPTATTLALAVNGLIGVVTVSTAAALQVFAGWDGAIWLTLILAASLIPSALSVAGRARLQSQLRWRDTAKVNVVETTSRYAGGIGLAAAGLGPISLAGAAVFASLAQWWQTLRSGAGRGVPLLGYDPAVARDLLRQAGWLMLGGFGITLTTMGDYLVLGFTEDERTAGLYFFGYQLTSPLAAVFITNMTGVLMPVLSSAQDDPARVARGVRRATLLLCALVPAVAVALALTSPALIHLIWQGKYDGAIPATVLVTMALMFIIPGSTFYVLADAKGLWRRRTTVQVADGAGLVAAAALGGWLGGVFAIALSVTIYRTLVSTALTFAAVRLAGLRRREMATGILLPPASAVAAIVLAFGACHAAGLAPTSIAGGLIACGVGGAAFAAAAWLGFRERIVEAAGVMLPKSLTGRFRRGSASAPPGR